MNREDLSEEVIWKPRFKGKEANLGCWRKENHREKDQPGPSLEDRNEVCTVQE